MFTFAIGRSIPLLAVGTFTGLLKNNLTYLKLFDQSNDCLVLINHQKNRGKNINGINFIEIEQAKPVAIVFPDQEENQFGTLLIPNTLCRMTVT